MVAFMCKHTRYLARPECGGGRGKSGRASWENRIAQCLPAGVQESDVISASNFGPGDHWKPQFFHL